MQNILLDTEYRVVSLPETKTPPSWLPEEGIQSIGIYNRQGQHHIINIRRANEAEGGSHYVYIALLSTEISTNPELVGGTLETTQLPILETHVEDLFRTFHYEDPTLIKWFYIPCKGPDNFCLR